MQIYNGNYGLPLHLDAMAAFSVLCIIKRKLIEAVYRFLT